MGSHLHCRYQTESTREGGVGGWCPLDQAADQPERGLGRRMKNPQWEVMSGGLLRYGLQHQE